MKNKKRIVCILIAALLCVIIAIAFAFLMKQPLGLTVKTDLGGRRGMVTAYAEKGVPHVAYAFIKAYDKDNQFLESMATEVKDGRGYYNVYGKNHAISRLEITLTSDKAGKKALSETASVQMEDICLPPVFITEITGRQVKTYYPDDKKENGGAYEEAYQFVELYNYSDEAADLGEYSFIYNVEKEHRFEFMWESGSDKILEPGELFVIGVYGKDTAGVGYRYDTDEDMAAYWEGFNAFYGVDVPLTNRAMIACVESGNGEATLDGISQLMRSVEAGTHITAEIRRGDETVTKVDLGDDGKPTSGYSFQFMPGNGDTKEESFLFCTGNFPYALLSEQKLDYTEKVYLSDHKAQNVLSYNVLATDEPKRRIYDRYPLFIKTIRDLDVDIFGLQEVNGDWIALLEGKDLTDYACVEGYSNHGKTYATITGNTWDIMNPIYYKSAKYNLLDSGSAYLTPDGALSTKQWDSLDQTRTLTYAVLENKETGAVTSFINTHLVLSGKEARNMQVSLLCQKGEELKKKYGGGVVIMGDNNLLENSEPYRIYGNGGLYGDAKYLTTNHTSGSTTPVFGENSSVYGSPIDFCFVTPDAFIVEKYAVIYGVYPEGTVSDHAGVYAELLNK